MSIDHSSITALGQGHEKQAEDQTDHLAKTYTVPSLVVDVVIPALNEAEALPFTLKPLMEFVNGQKALPRSKAMIRTVVLVDNGSTDHTAEVAQAYGAQVISEPRRGYGQACLAGIAALKVDPPQALLFVDADGSDDLSDLDHLLALLQIQTPSELQDDTERYAIQTDKSPDLVIGSRARLAEANALTPLQRFGNALSCRLLKWFFGAKFTDLGPFRVIRWSALKQIQMVDTNYGWTVEMQAKASVYGLCSLEKDVRYFPRKAGDSKVSGTLKGSFKAGVKILWTIWCSWLSKFK